MSMKLKIKEEYYMSVKYVLLLQYLICHNALIFNKKSEQTKLHLPFMNNDRLLLGYRQSGNIINC
jgi:hypothetical protein